MKMYNEQFERFCFITDSLAIFANKKLKISNCLYNEKTKFVDAQERHKVLSELFESHRDIIDEYVKKNEYDLLDSQLKEVKSWKNAITGIFVYCGEKDNNSIFSCDEFAFAVTGTDRDIEEMLPDCPCILETTLLPFEGIVTFARSLARSCIEFGAGMMAQIKQEQNNALSGKIIQTAHELNDIATIINKKKIESKNKSDKVVSEISKRNEKRPNIPASSGKHKGVLAGLNFEERKALIKKHKDQELENFKKTNGKYPFSGMIEKEVETTKPIFSAKEYYENYPNEYIKETEKNPEGYAFNCLKSISDYAYDLIKKAAKNHFSITVKEKEYLDFLQHAPFIFFPYGAPFYHDNKLELIIFEEYQKFFKELDWNLVDKERAMTQAVINTCIKTSSLMGIVRAVDVFDQFLNWYPEYKYYFSVDDFIETSAYPQTIPGCISTYRTIEDEETQIHYLVDGRLYEKANIYDIDLNDEEEAKESVNALHFMTNYLLEKQEKIGVKTFPKVYRDQNVEDVCVQLPALSYMVDFLNERVPDNLDDEFSEIGIDEYKYADQIVYDFIEECMTSVNSFLKPNEFIESWNLDFDEDELKEFVYIFMDCSNSMPVWDNAGRSPEQLLHETGGPKIFRNEHGGMKKIGRNEPCPCGSGKKYKKCCGARHN